MSSGWSLGSVRQVVEPDDFVNNKFSQRQLKLLALALASDGNRVRTGAPMNFCLES